MRHLWFEYPLAWLVGLPMAAAAVGLMMWSLRRQGQAWRRVGVLAVLRGGAAAARGPCGPAGPH